MGTETRGENRVPTLEHEWKALVRRYGIPVPAGVFVPCEERPTALPPAIQCLRPPLVLKAISPAIVHKSEVGAVQVGIPALAALEAAIDQLFQGLGLRGLLPLGGGILVEQMAEPGAELALGMVPSGPFGRLLAFGVGGTMVEALGEVRFFALPLRKFDVDSVLASLPWLERTLARRSPSGATALREVLWRFAGPGGLALDPCIGTLEINPLIVGRTGAWAVDVRGETAIPAAAR